METYLTLIFINLEKQIEGNEDVIISWARYHTLHYLGKHEKLIANQGMVEE